MTYRISDIAAIIKGKFVLFSHEATVGELLLDSRRVSFPETSLFFALKGPRRNGHDFVVEAYLKGIRNFIIDEEISLDELRNANVITVKDTLDALQCLATHHRARFHIPVIGITGSNGKTIVKEWLNDLLADRFTIVRSPKSYNSQIGVPLSVWQLNEDATLAIFEAGISQSGEMDKLQKIIQPDIGIFTNIGDAHASGFLNVKQKLREKLRLFTKVKHLVYCRDYPELNEAVASMYQQLKTGSDKPFEIMSWSRKADAELQILSIEKSDAATNVVAEYKAEQHTIRIPFTDEASIENAIHCWCVMLHFNIPSGEIAARMAALHPVAMRLELKTGINNSSIINDSYSADLSSLRIALDFLAQQHQHSRRTVILTDFLESGRSEKDLYTDIAKALEKHKVDRFIGIGPVISRNQFVFKSAAEQNEHRRWQGNNGSMETRFFPTVEDFKREIANIHFANETILIKGARMFALEQINQLLQRQTHQTQLEIDLNALLHNLKTYQQTLRPDTKMMAMVKAFSYGSGSYEIASVLQFNKVDYLAVAYADEGVALRNGGITLPIMVMNPDESSFNTLVSHHLEPEMYAPGLMRAFGNFLRDEGLHHYPIHIEVETGMNRLGFSEYQLSELTELLQSNLFKVQSVFSHLVGSEDPELDYFTRHQAGHFEYLAGRIREAVDYPFLRHLLNTSGISRHADLQYDLVRIGIGLYGIDNSQPELREVSTLKSAVAQIKYLKAGETVSYNRSGQVHRDSKIATVRLGYADGYPRSLGNGRGRMLINGQYAPTIGNICMDMTMIDVTDVENVEEGDQVIVFGKGLPVADVAKWCGTIPYEILTGVSQRVKRVYFQE